MRKPVTLAIVGAGQRGAIYAQYAAENPHLAQVVAVAEPRPHRRRTMAQKYTIDPSNVFSDWMDLVERGKTADAVVVCVLDELHARAVHEFAAQGYHILCEKPMATSIEDCLSMVADVKKAGVIFGVGHVLRYSPYNFAVKAVIDSGNLGEIVNIQHIEPVGHEHFAHSFVRGNWRNEATTSFALMTKSCQYVWIVSVTWKKTTYLDVDVLSFYLSSAGSLNRPTKISSFGSLSHFKPSKKPVEARSKSDSSRPATRCTDCTYESSCPYSAKKIYLDPIVRGGEDHERWAQHIVDAEILDIENVGQAISEGPYGLCVYNGQNDVVDNQVVNIQYESGATASLTMVAFTEQICNRATRIHGIRGELVGDMNTFTVFDFLTKTSKHYSPPLDGGGHGGGDMGLACAFVQAVAKNDQGLLKITPDEVLQSHLAVFAGEVSRKEERVVDFQKFLQGLKDGELSV